MIKSKNGKVQIIGNIAVIYTDLTIILKSLRENIPHADKWIEIAMADSLKSEEEIIEEVKRLETERGAVNGAE